MRNMPNIHSTINPCKKSDYAKCLKYIDEYWPKLTFCDTQDYGKYIGLPNAFVSPNDSIFRNDQFYWDSYFTILGLVSSGRKEHVVLAKGMVDNLVYLYKRFGIIPSRNRIYNLGISQIPFLTSMILEVFEKTHDFAWLERTAAVAEEELHNVWMDGKRAQIVSRQGSCAASDTILRKFRAAAFSDVLKNFHPLRVPMLTPIVSELFPDQFSDLEPLPKGFEPAKARAEKRMVYKGLSRYCDHHITHLTAEHESGWDMTSRFNDHCLNYLPIDLNSCLYKYASDLAAIFRLIEKHDKARKFSAMAYRRKKVINELMWNNKSGFFFDYDFINLRQSRFFSLAGFYPMWAGIATKAQAEKMRRCLRIFECAGGLANTKKTELSHEFKQWDYPNGWPNQQWLVIKGLLNYGYSNDAERIAIKWLDLNKKMFNKTNKFWEKYDVVNCTIGKSGSYPTQSGFGWTNSVFVKLVNKFCG